MPIGRNWRRLSMPAANTRLSWCIAKLDRLSRNLAFIATLMRRGSKFVAVDNPHASKLTLHILAAVAEHEREAIRNVPVRRLQRPRRHEQQGLGTPDTAGAVKRMHAALELGDGGFRGQRAADHSRDRGRWT